MNKTEREIYKAFDGKLIGTRFMKIHVCSVLALMPREIVTFVTEKCWFIGSMEDAWALTFKGNEIRNKYLIFLSDELLAQEASQIRHSIAHEIGHVVLNHRNSILVHQSKEEVRQQERAAEKFASTYDT